MALTDAIVASIEAELAALKEVTIIASTPAASVEPEVTIPVTPEPQVHQAPAADINALTQLALDQAAARSVLEVAK
jgi:hypothetical protein